MGRVTIESGGEEGLYTVSVDAGESLRDARVAKLETRQAELTAEIAAKEVEITDRQDYQQSTFGVVNAAIVTYNASEQTPEDRAPVIEAVASRNYATHVLGIARNQLTILKSDLINVGGALTMLGAMDLTDTQQIWCADFSEESEGEVDAIEIDGEPTTILIAPQGNETPSTDDPGHLLARGVMSPEQAFFNAAILPGWQMWKPTFRLGEITSIDYEADECSVDLDAAISSAQNLNINKLNSLSGVPVEYMDCMAAAFEEGDRVVVKFEGQDWESPKVIGFASQPKPCGQGIARWFKTIPGSNDDSQYLVCVLKSDNNRGYGDDLIDTQSNDQMLNRTVNPWTAVEYRRSDQDAWTRMMPTGYHGPNSGPLPGTAGGVVYQKQFLSGDVVVEENGEVHIEWTTMHKEAEENTPGISQDNETYWTTYEFNDVDYPCWLRIYPRRFDGWDTHDHEIRVWTYGLSRSPQIRRILHFAFNHANTSISVKGFAKIDAIEDMASLTPSAADSPADTGLIIKLENYIFPPSVPADYW